MEDELEIIAKTYQTFKALQLTQEENAKAYKAAKQQLTERLRTLNDTLNQQLHQATAPGIDYVRWLASHQPFHWIAEFYDIIHGNGGFDVIIGNPPYVEYTRKNVSYTICDYETLKCGNLYSFVFERSFSLCSHKIGLIVQLSSIGTEAMRDLQAYLKNNTRTLFYCCFPERPKQLFEGACIALSIILCHEKSKECGMYGGGIMRHSDVSRNILFRNISYISLPPDSLLKPYLLYPKFKNNIEVGIVNKFFADKPLSTYISNTQNTNIVSYRTAGGRYWKIFITRKFATSSTSNKSKCITRWMN